MKVQLRTEEIGKKLLRDAREAQADYRKKHAAEMLLLEWCMRHEELRNRTFRFIDVFPTLQNSGQILQHLREYFPRSEHRLPPAVKAALLMTQPSLLTRGLVSGLTSKLYRKVASLFIGAADAEEAVEQVRAWNRQGVHLSIDLLGEKTISEKEAFQYQKRYEALIHSLGALKMGPEKQNVSVKLSALDPRFNVLDPDGTSRRVRTKLSPLLNSAQNRGVFLHVDMEEYESRDLTLKIIRDLMDEEAFRGGVDFGIVLQAYLKDAEACYDELIAWARDLPKPLTIRLVRGAYWDTEIMRAEALHWPVPVFTEKQETDAMFEHLSARILEEVPKVKLAVATHNIRSLAYVMALAEAKEIPATHLEFQVLYGMGAPFVAPIRNAGWVPRVYMPIGDPVSGMAYLVRRLLENVSSQSFARRLHEAGEMAADFSPPSPEDPKEEGAKSLASETDSASEEYRPAALLQFHKKTVRSYFGETVRKTEKELGQKIPVVIGRKEKQTQTRLEVVSPVDGRTLVGRVSLATPQDAAGAVAAAEKYSGTWQRTPVAERAACLRAAAKWILRRRSELAALQVYEVGKPWREADADVVEAIDFLNFYAFHAEKTQREQTTELLSQETNVLVPQARGVCAVIAPWNFPTAILTGMSAAALVTGNPVVMKPAEQSFVCGWYVFQAFRAAGIPPEAIHFLPGIGEEVGPALVKHPATAVIAFTGSKEVGQEIMRLAAVPEPGTRLIKHCVVELGGKNAMVVDSTADFDVAVPAALSSAFGYAGQKCSALSRLIIVEEIYDAFTKRLVEAAKDFCIGSPCEPETHYGPVISEEARKRIEETIQRGAKEGRVMFQAEVSPSLSGYFVPLTLLADLPHNSEILQREIFGPVLAVVKTANFKEGLEMAARSDFALTGGVFSRTPSHIQMARDRFETGNLYINRGITGSLVRRQPFGGFKLSGGGAKAGGPDYLREFFFYRTVTEDVSRHGFAPLK